MRCGRTLRVPSVQPPDCGNSNSLKRWSRGPMNMRILRVFAAAAVSIVSREIFSGGSMMTLDPFPSTPLGVNHSTLTPMERSTSMRRLTSSIFGTFRSVVRPRFKREAARRATAPFLERLVSTLPESCFPPSMMKFISPCMRVSYHLPQAFALCTATRYHGGDVIFFPQAWN